MNKTRITCRNLLINSLKQSMGGRNDSALE
jgi:hypothetical protein